MIVSMIIRKLYSGQVHRIFLLFVILLFGTTVCDMLSSAPLSAIDPGLRDALREGGTFVYFLLHTSVLPLYVIFMGLAAGTWYKFIKRRFNKVLFSLPYIINIAAVLSNPWTHAIYRIVDGKYTRGDYILLTYVVGAFYGVLTVYYLAKYKGVLDTMSMIAFFSIYPYTVVAVLIQYFYPTHLLEMFAYSVAVLTIMIFVIRPEKMLNLAVGSKTMAAFWQDTKNIYLSEKKTHIYIIKVNSDSSIIKLYGINMHDAIMRELVTKINAKVRTIVPTGAYSSVYYLNYGLFAVSIENKYTSKDTCGQLYEAMCEKIHTDNNMTLLLECAVCEIAIPEDMPTFKDVVSFIDTFEKSSAASGAFIYSDLTQQEKIKMSFDIDRYIRKAIANNSFQMYYQPIYSVKENKFVTAEALIRLNDDEVGFISPEVFIPAAEKSGAIYDIGKYVIDSVFGFIRKAEQYGVKYIEINISAMQCMSDSFVDEIKDKLTEYGVSNKAVNFELTESASEILDDVLRKTVTMLHAEGIEFSIDDYGTGYSNLHRIMSEPIKIIKIDRSLISSISDDKTRAVIADTIKMIKSIGMEVVAEGVETADTAQWLIDNGCDYIQGFYYAKPMPEDQYIEFLQRIS